MGFSYPGPDRSNPVFHDGRASMVSMSVRPGHAEPVLRALCHLVLEAESVLHPRTAVSARALAAGAVQPGRHTVRMRAWRWLRTAAR